LPTPVASASFARMIRAFLALLVSAVVVHAFSDDTKQPSANALIDRVITSPGSYSQMCDIPPPLSVKVPLPVYSLVLTREVHVSEDDFAELRDRRAEVVSALVQRLAALDLSKPAPPVEGMQFAEIKDGESDKLESSGVSPRYLSGLLFEIIVGLDAVETLPELLRLEEQMRSLLAAADADPNVAPPQVLVDGFLTPPQGDKKLKPRDEEFLKGRVFQRELLSVMLQLLRRQHYQPLLDSDFEKTYVKAIKERAKQEDLRDIKTPADAKAKGDDWVKFDLITKIPLGYMEKQPEVPFSREVREQIRGWAKAFTKDVPPEDWKVNDALPPQ